MVYFYSTIKKMHGPINITFKMLAHNLEAIPNNSIASSSELILLRWIISLYCNLPNIYTHTHTHTHTQAVVNEVKNLSKNSVVWSGCEGENFEYSLLALLITLLFVCLFSDTCFPFCTFSWKNLTLHSLLTWETHSLSPIWKKKWNSFVFCFIIFSPENSQIFEFFHI